LKAVISRFLKLPEPPDTSFFLWGPRQTGKSWLLKQTYAQGFFRDLLKTELFARYVRRPSRLREEVAHLEPGAVVVLDEIQRVPQLLDEVHWLIENQGLVFAMCGSSARKLRRGHANLLGGRALRYELFGLVSEELGADFDLTRALNHGYLPRHYLAGQPRARLRAYVGDYLKEEVAAEGLVRNLPAFADFLRAASLSDTETVSYTAIARDCGVSAPTVREYFQILVDTLLGRYLPAYTRRARRRVQQAPKFYFADVGVVNHLARRGTLAPGSELFGKAFENWVFHELSAFGVYSERYDELSFWRLHSGGEVDFVLNDAEVALEAKASSSIHNQHLRGLRDFREEYPEVRRLVVVCLEAERRRTEDGIDVLPVRDFTRILWSGEL
jgi:predicted AAA+ superfamily ATPase